MQCKRRQLPLLSVSFQGLGSQLSRSTLQKVKVIIRHELVQAGLYNQGRQPGCSLSGHQRYEPERPSDADNLPKTVESRSLSQVLEKQCEFCQVADQDDPNAEQPFLRLFVGVCEVGATSRC